METVKIELFISVDRAENITEGMCPKCKVFIDRGFTHCPYCGSQLDWSKAIQYESEGGEKDAR